MGLGLLLDSNYHLFCFFETQGLMLARQALSNLDPHPQPRLPLLDGLCGRGG